MFNWGWRTFTISHIHLHFNSNNSILSNKNLNTSLHVKFLNSMHLPKFFLPHSSWNATLNFILTISDCFLVHCIYRTQSNKDFSFFFLRTWMHKFSVTKNFYKVYIYVAHINKDFSNFLVQGVNLYDSVWMILAITKYLIGIVLFSIRYY